LKRGEAQGPQAPFYTVRVVGGLLIIERTMRRYDSLEQVPVSFADLRAMIDKAEPFDVAVLDLRQALGRNDAEFEAQLAPERRMLLRRLPQVVFVVKTNIGRMQIERYLQRDGVTPYVYTSFEDAVLEAKRLQRSTNLGPSSTRNL